jgi:anti-sigma-K factor RskA
VSSRDLEPPCEHLDSTAAYVLGALEDEEAANFARHLEACSECRREVSEMAPIVDLMASAVPPRTAPRELGERVIAQVRSEADLLKAAGPAADQPPARAQARWRPRPLAAWATAAALAVGIAVSLVVGGVRGVHQTRASVTVAGASALLRQSGARAELVVSHLPAPAAGRIYQLWVQRSGRPPAPTDVLFGVSRAGRAAVDVPGSLRGVKRLMVTSEPQGGSSAPTSAPVITVAPLSE